jgi:hypothetical protein
MVVARSHAGERKSEEKRGEGPARSCIQSQPGPCHKPQAQQTRKQESQIRQYIQAVSYAGDTALIGKMVISLWLGDGREKRDSGRGRDAYGSDDSPLCRWTPFPQPLNQSWDIYFPPKSAAGTGTFFVPASSAAVCVMLRVEKGRKKPQQVLDGGAGGVVGAGQLPYFSCN